MGRLRKSAVDEIVKLRKRGYTQAETAEKVNVHLKTVQKYDPLRKTRKTSIAQDPIDIFMSDVEMGLKALEDWIKAFYITLSTGLKTKLICPDCLEGELEFSEEAGFSLCNNCAYEIYLPATFVLASKAKAANSKS